MKKIVVIGSNSFSGSHFVDLLIHTGGFEVVGVSRSREKHKAFLPYRWHTQGNKPIIGHSTFRFFQADLNLHRKKLYTFLDRFRPEYIINFAGLVEVASSWNYPRDYFETNTLGVVSLADHLKDKQYLRKYIHISTPEVYGTTTGKEKENAIVRPSTPYAASKLASDMYLMALYRYYAFPVIFVRSTNVYGPGQQVFRIIPKTIISIKNGKRIPLEGGGKAVKSYIHIGDVSKGELVILRLGKTGEIYHISPDSSIAISSLVKLVCKHLRVSFNDYVSIVSDRRGQDKAYVLDSSKLRSYGWKPRISLEEGIGQVSSWIDEYWSVLKREPLTYTHQF